MYIKDGNMISQGTTLRVKGYSLIVRVGGMVRNSVGSGSGWAVAPRQQLIEFL